MWRIVIRNSEWRTVAAAGRWSLQDWIAGSRLVVVGLVVTVAGVIAAVVGLVTVDAERWSLVQNWQLLVLEGSCCCRKVVNGEEMVAAVAGLVAAGAGLVREGSCSCWKVVAGAGR